MNIKAARLRANLTQAQLAAIMGVTQSCVAAWERGDYFPSSQSLPALAKALGCTIDDLYLSGDEEVPEYAEAAEG